MALLGLLESTGGLILSYFKNLPIKTSLDLT